MDSMTAPDLSVVIIARNEEATLGRNLDVLLPEIAGLNAEVVVVDSGSTDSTREIARRYPVKLVELQDSPYRSPAAARYIGTLFARGKIIYYMDGDMILVTGWLQRGMQELGNPTIAGIAGRLLNVDPGHDLSDAREDDFPLGDVDTLQTSGMYRRDVLETAYTFNPFIKGEEELELGYRILRAGYRLVRLSVPMGYHCFKTPTTTLIDRKAGYFAGHGQIFRKYGTSSLSTRVIREYGIFYAESAAVYSALLLPLPAILLLFLFRHDALAFILLGLQAAAWGILTALKGFRKVFLHVRSRLFIPVNIIKGYMIGLPDPHGYQKLVRFRCTDEHGNDITSRAS